MTLSALKPYLVLVRQEHKTRETDYSPFGRYSTEDEATQRALEIVDDTPGVTVTVVHEIVVLEPVEHVWEKTP